MTLISAVTVFSALFVYNLSISDTIELYREYKALKNKVDELPDIHNRITYLKQEVAVIESELGYGSSAASLNLLKELSKYCTENNIELKSIPPIEEYTEDDIVFQNQSFVVQASFKSLVKLVRYLEEKEKIGRLISVKYDVVVDMRTKIRKLNAYCVVQNILIGNYEV